MVMILEEKDVQGLIDRAQAVGVIERTYRAAARGDAGVSVPSALHLRGKTGAGAVFKVKGAVLDDLGVAGFRLIGDLDSPSGGGCSYTYLVDASTAAPIALVAEGVLHRVRTALTGLVACRALAPKHVATLALIGTGRIAEEFVRCIDLVTPGHAILVASRSTERACVAAEKWRSLTRSRIDAAASIKQAVAQAEIVVTLSDADERLFEAADLKPGALVCAMGGRREFDRDVLDAAEGFVVDEFDFVCSAGNGSHWLKSGQITRAALESKVDATIGEILLGRRQIQTTGVVLAIIQGMAVCDIALATAVYNGAAAKKG